MKSSFRWYGDSDPVTLDMIRQIPGMRSIVSAVPLRSSFAFSIRT